MTALTGLKVLELAESVSGEYCGKLLADFGAQIIKIERPGTGSPTRRMGPFASDAAGTEHDGEHSGLFAYLNTGKHSVELDVSAPSGKETLQTLLSCVDAVVDDHDVVWLKALELDAESAQKNYADLVICSITPFGLEPPEDRRHAEDITVFHSSGWGFHTPTGADPKQTPLSGAGRFLPSYEAGVEAAMCMVAALFERQQSKLGQFIEISKQDVLASRIDYVLAQMVTGEMNVGTHRTAYDLSGPAGIFPCKDGFIYIWLSTPAHWQGIRQLLDDTEWMNDFSDNWLEKECTPDRVKTCRHHLSLWLKNQNKHEAAEKAQKLGVTLVAVNNAQDLLASPQYQFRQFFVALDHPTLGSVRYPTVPYHLSATPAKPSHPAPLLGRHTDVDLSETSEPHQGVMG